DAIVEQSVWRRRQRVLAAAAVESVSGGGAGGPRQSTAPAVDIDKVRRLQRVDSGPAAVKALRSGLALRALCLPPSARAELGKQNFYEKDSQPSAASHVTRTSSRREMRPYCQEAILDRCCTAPFTESSGLPRARRETVLPPTAYNDAFAPKCAACSKAITSNYLTALEKMWHTEVLLYAGGLRQRLLYRELSTSTRASRYCELHYHAHRGSLLHACEKPITSKCITAMGRKFHPAVLRVAFILQNETVQGPRSRLVPVQ
uniref:Uncharacterized protein n=1 Tax=Macrostomum lignano TaxID=282301 RepID=A0A1I8FI10_9PLAT